MTNNANAEMPRSYYQANNSIGAYYNWYGATAETGTYGMVSGNAEDSLCPAGWILPYGTATNQAKSWRGLIYGSYGLSNNFESSNLLRGSTMTLVIQAKQYGHIDGTISTAENNARLWSNTVNGQGSVRHLSLYAGSFTPIQTAVPNVGFSVRCVLE